MKNMKKRAISIILAIIMVLTLIPVTVTSAGPGETQVKVGDPLGDVLYSDIVAFIDGYAIPTSVKSGVTMVVVEDLMNYGFDVAWNKSDKTLKVERNENKTFKPLTVVKDTTNKPGTFKCKYVYTDIKTYISGELVDSFAINGVTLINFELLARYGNLNWNSAAREIKLTLNKTAPPPGPKPKPEPEIPGKYEFLVMDKHAEWEIFMAQNVYGLGNSNKDTYSDLEDNLTWDKFEPVLKSFKQKFGKAVDYSTPVNKKDYLKKGAVISYLYKIITDTLKIKKPEPAVDYFAKNGLINVNKKGEYPLDEICAGNEMIILSVRVYEHICYERGLFAKGFFWKVTGGEHTMYLLGSVHVGNGSLYPLSKEIEAAFDSSKYLAVERDFASDSKKDDEYFWLKARIPGIGRIKDYLDPKTYEMYEWVCLYFGVPRNLFDTLYPWSAAMLIDELAWYATLDENTDDGIYDGRSIFGYLGIDYHFIYKSSYHDKKIIGIETSKTRTDMSVSYSRELQEALLRGSLYDLFDVLIGSTSSDTTGILNMLTVWKNGDENKLIKMVEADANESNPLNVEYNYKLMTERNELMFNRIMEFLTTGDGDYFVIVGAAHMVGSDGLVQRLIEGGFKVERIK